MNTFLELKENNADVKNTAGDFTTRLRKPISLFDGDQVILNKAIIDSRSVDSGKILLKNDLELTLSFYYYLINSDGLGKEDISGNPWATTSIDAEPYILSQQFAHSAGEVQELNKVSIKYQSQSSGYTGPDTLELVYQYIPVGTTLPIPVVLFLKRVKPPSGTIYPFDTIYSTEELGLNGKVNAGTPTFKRLTTNKEIITAGGGTTPNPDGSNSGFLINTLVESIADVPAAGSHYEPVLATKSFTLKKGSYSAVGISKRINQQMTKILDGDTYSTTNTVSINAFLKKTNDSNYGTLNAPLFLRYDGDLNTIDGGTPYKYKGIFKYESTPPTNFMFGASQMALSYDELSNRFQWDFKHFPLYNTSSQIITKMVEIGETTPLTDYRVVNSVGGVLFQSLISKEIINDVLQPVSTSFWSNTLGFDLSTLCVIPSHKNNTILTRIPTFPKLVLGQSITGAEIGMDMFINKAIAPTALALSNIAPIIGTATIPIIAGKDFELSSVESGYFMIEINGLNTEMITNNSIKSHIFGIVSRYYETNNYTTGTEADAIIYTHRGSPLYLNELKIRILDTNYNVANIGSDNVIFLQVLNQPRQMVLNKKEEKK